MENQDKIIEVLKEKLEQTEMKLSNAVQDYNDKDIECKKLATERDAHLETIEQIRNTCKIEKEKFIIEKNNLETKINDCSMLVQNDTDDADDLHSRPENLKKSPGAKKIREIK